MKLLFEHLLSLFHSLKSFISDTHPSLVIFHEGLIHSWRLYLNYCLFLRRSLGKVVVIYWSFLSFWWILLINYFFSHFISLVWRNIYLPFFDDLIELSLSAKLMSSNKLTIYFQCLKLFLKQNQLSPKLFF